MYAIAIVRYRKPMEEVEKATPGHRAYLQGLVDQGLVLVSGPMDPRTGGVVLLRVPDGDVHGTLDRVRDGDPFVIQGIAQWELLPWKPTFGVDKLDRL